MTKKDRDKGKRPMVPAVGHSNAYLSLVEEDEAEVEVQQAGHVADAQVVTSSSAVTLFCLHGT